MRTCTKLSCLHWNSSLSCRKIPRKRMYYNRNHLNPNESSVEEFFSEPSELLRLIAERFNQETWAFISSRSWSIVYYWFTWKCFRLFLDCTFCGDGHPWQCTRLSTNWWSASRWIYQIVPPSYPAMHTQRYRDINHSIPCMILSPNPCDALRVQVTNQKLFSMF